MRIPKTPKEFDYDLWTAENGKYMIRVKRTGEECEVDQDTMRFLRAEEKRLRRSMAGIPMDANGDEKVSILSLDYTSGDAPDIPASSWLKDPIDMEMTVLSELVEQAFVETLTPRQKDVYEMCLLGGMGLREYSRFRKIDCKTVYEVRAYIRKKFEKFIT